MIKNVNQTIRIFGMLMVSLALMACGGGSGSDEPQIVTEQRIVTRTADDGFSSVVVDLVDDLERSDLLPDYNYMENTYDEKGRLDIQYLSETGILDDESLYDTCTYVYSDEGYVLKRTYDLNVDAGRTDRKVWNFDEHGGLKRLEFFRSGVLSQAVTRMFEYDSRGRKKVVHFDSVDNGVIDRITYYTYEGQKVFRFRDVVGNGNKFYDISTYNDEGDLIQFDETDEDWNVIDSDEYEYTYTYDSNDNLIAKKTVDSRNRERNFTYEWQEYEVNE